MFLAEIADQEAAKCYCRACPGRIREGEIVLHLKLGHTMPYDARHHYFHLQCASQVVAEADELDLVEGAAAAVAATRQEMAATGDFFVEIQK